MDNYLSKYLKYKNKYLELKNTIGGAGNSVTTGLSKNESRFVRTLISFLRHDELIDDIIINDDNTFSPGKIKKKDVIIKFDPEEVPFIRNGSFGSTGFRGLYIPTLLRIIKETPFQFGGKFFRVEKGIKNPIYNEFLELEKFTQLIQMLTDESSNSRIIYDNKNLILAITSGVSVNNSIFKLLFKDPSSPKVSDSELLINFPKYGIKSDGNVLHASEHFLPSQKPPFDGTMKPMDRSLHVIICSGDMETDFRYVSNKISSGGKWKSCRYFFITKPADDILFTYPNSENISTTESIIPLDNCLFGIIDTDLKIIGKISDKKIEFFDGISEEIIKEINDKY